MSYQALMIRDDKAQTVKYAFEVECLKNNALITSALVGKVTNAEENATAVAAQIEIQKVIKAAKDASDELTKAAEAYKKRVWKTRDEFLGELNSEILRVSILVGDFQALEQAKARAAEALRQQELSKIEREKQEALSKVTSHEALDAVQEHFTNKAAEVVSSVAAPIRAGGQVVKTDWEIVVTNPYDLAKYHPACVNISPRLTEIKQLLNEGVTIKGITATKITKSGVRVGKSQEAIEV